MVSSARTAMVAAVQFLYSSVESKSYITDSFQAETIVGWLKHCNLSLSLADVQASQVYHCLVGVTNPSFDPMQQEEASTSDRSPKSFVIVHNVAKKHNIGTLARSCTAFNVVQARLLQITTLLALCFLDV